ncbi:MAG: hypothetical protein KME16_20835 [Scytolyngbya sp. HA4215-MV1]|jgi:hypothetical protein|nr:hypothetical protein [Scytolyngbya sp. HA4215-MV1]
MKGFGYSQEKRAIVQVIQKRNLKEAEKLLNRLERQISGEQLLSLLMEAISTLPVEDATWAAENLIPDEVYDNINEQVSMMLYQSLIDKGFRPGRDFRVTEAGLILSPAAHAAILPDVPAEYQEIFTTEMVTIQTESAIDVLEAELGVPFVDNLIQRIEQRLPTLNDLQASMYLFNICEGVETRTDIPIMEILIGHFGEDQRFNLIFDLIQRGESAENSDWISDLVASAGGEAELMPDPDDPTGCHLSPKASQLLDQVYQGSRSLEPLIQASHLLDERA